MRPFPGSDAPGIAAENYRDIVLAGWKTAVVVVVAVAGQRQPG